MLQRSQTADRQMSCSDDLHRQCTWTDTVETHIGRPHAGKCCNTQRQPKEDYEYICYHLKKESYVTSKGLLLWGFGVSNYCWGAR